MSSIKQAINLAKVETAGVLSNIACLSLCGGCAVFGLLKKDTFVSSAMGVEILINTFFLSTTYKDAQKKWASVRTNTPERSAFKVPTSLFSSFYAEMSEHKLFAALGLVCLGGSFLEGINAVRHGDVYSSFLSMTNGVFVGNACFNLARSKKNSTDDLYAKKLSL